MRRSEASSRASLRLDLSPVVRLDAWAITLSVSVTLVTVLPNFAPELLAASALVSLAALVKPDFTPESWRLMAVLLPLFVGGGVAIALLHASAPDPLEQLAALEPGEVLIVGRVASPPVSSGFGYRSDLRVEKLSYGGRDVIEGGGVELYAPGLDGVGVGDRLHVSGELSIPAPGEDGFDYARYLSTKRISAVLEAEQAESVGEGRGWIGVVHRRTDMALGYGLRPREASVVRGMVLGDRSLIPEELAESFQRSGITHILAISGQHVAILAALIYFSLRSLALPFAARAPITGALIWTYILVAGAPPSAVRAGVVATIVLGAGLVGRQVSPLHFMSTMLAFVLAYNPLLIYSSGFQLSVAAVVGILLLREPLNALLRRTVLLPLRSTSKSTDLIANLISISLAAQVATAPIIASSFGNVSVVGVATNLVAVPISGPILTLGLLSALSGNVASFLAYPLNAVNGFLVSVLEFAARAASSLPFASVPTPHVSLAMVALFYLGCVPCALCRWTLPRTRWPFWAAVAVVWCALWLVLESLVSL